MATNQTLPKSEECGVRITQVRISNFRSLENIEVDLDELTVLVGANNSGKTSFLDALYAAIGSGRRIFGREEIHLKNGETDVPQSRKAIIDIRVQPCCDAEGKFLDSFPQGSFWTGLWGDAIAQDYLGDDNFQEFVGIRTAMTWSAAHNEYRIEREFLKEWGPFSLWPSSSSVMDKRVTSSHLEPIALHYVNAQRDIEEDLHSAGSFWRRLISDLGLPDAAVEKFEEILTDLNAQIVENSPVLVHIRSHLEKMDNVVSAERTGIDITPVARHLRDLAKGIDINFATTGAQSFPLAKHGMGTRSLASILVFRAYASWKSGQASSHQNQIHPLLALEEPETHLHPQAQRSLFRQIKEIPGQRILSTHSPYFAGQARLEELRLFQKVGGSSSVSRLDTSSLDVKDLRNLEYRIIRTHGDILFGRAWILFEGETEELALPIFAQAYWGASIHELGFNFMSVGGTNYHPFIWLAKELGIKWYIFSDGEENPVKKVNNALSKIGLNGVQACDNVFVLPDGRNYEKHLVVEGYFPEVEDVLRTVPWFYKDLNDYIDKIGNQMRTGGLTRNYDNDRQGREVAAIDAMDKRKLELASPVATAITATTDPERRCPAVITDLFKKISDDFGLKKAGGNP